MDVVLDDRVREEKEDWSAKKLLGGDFDIHGSGSKKSKQDQIDPTKINAIYTLVELQKPSGATCGVEKLILTTSNQRHPKANSKTKCKVKFNVNVKFQLRRQETETKKQFRGVVIKSVDDALLLEIVASSLEGWKMRLSHLLVSSEV
ncbi:hypothetical protein BELL_0618g00050 [Botrytis elliptica]|uniref:Uncharacterized protein n=1 Tax=Botrytis elliptica TaxID=278938 RepID=A0A4Z1JP72_9HELO|nr:hypothetical protein BELL_0618g00050 [Botrytis elliptica]